MNYSSLETTLYSKREFNIKVSVSNNFKTYNSIRGYKKDNLIRLKFKPVNSIIIGSRRNSSDTIMLPTEEYYEFVDCLKNVYKSFDLEDMYVLDKEDKLVLNRALSLENEERFVSYGKSLIIRTSVVEIDGYEYEGVDLIVNKKTVFSLNYNEFKKMYKLLKNVDILTYSLVSSMGGYLLPQDNLTTFDQFNDDMDLEKNDYYRSTNDHKDMLMSPRGNKKGGIWQ